jgi:hypothetical protein
MLCEAIEKKKKLEKRLQECVHEEKSNPKALRAGGVSVFVLLCTSKESTFVLVMSSKASKLRRHRATQLFPRRA